MLPTQNHIHLLTNLPGIVCLDAEVCVIKKGSAHDHTFGYVNV